MKCFGLFLKKYPYERYVYREITWKDFKDPFLVGRVWQISKNSYGYCLTLSRHSSRKLFRGKSTTFDQAVQRVLQKYENRI